MTSMSKYFNETMLQASCKDIIHPYTDSCLESAWYFWTRPFPSIFKLFLPILIIPLFTKSDRLDAELIKELLGNYGNAVMASFLTGTVGICLVCFFYKLLGRFDYYTILSLPATISGMSVFLANDKIARVFARSKLAMIIEICIQGGCNPLCKLLCNSEKFRTLAFMTLSATLLDTLQAVKSDIFWFSRPLKRSETLLSEPTVPSPVFDALIDPKRKVCSHKSSCDTFNFNEFKTFLKIGLGIEVFQGVNRHFSKLTSDPKNGIPLVIKSINYKFAAFVVCYPSLFRLTTCLFNRYFGSETSLGNGLAAFIAGSAFHLSQDVSIFSHASACVVETLWERYCASDIHKPEWVALFNRMPIARLFYAFGVGYLFHVRAFYPYLAPGLLKKIMQCVTNHQVDPFVARMAVYLLGAHGAA